MVYYYYNIFGLRFKADDNWNWKLAATADVPLDRERRNLNWDYPQKEIQILNEMFSSKEKYESGKYRLGPKMPSHIPVCGDIPENKRKQCRYEDKSWLSSFGADDTKITDDQSNYTTADAKKKDYKEKGYLVLKILAKTILILILCILSYVILSMLFHYNNWGTLTLSYLYIFIFGFVYVITYIPDSLKWSVLTIFLYIIIIIIMGGVFSTNEDFKYNISYSDTKKYLIPIYTNDGDISKHTNKYGYISVIVLIIINFVCSYSLQ